MKTKGVMAALLVTSALTIVPSGATAQFAVIVNPANPTTTLSFDELRRVFLGRKQQFADGLDVLLVESVPDRAAFYPILLGRTAENVRQGWIGLVFRGEAGSMPITAANAAECRAFVARTEGAIGFLDVAEVDESVKVVAIDGVLPGQPGYKLNRT